MSELRFRYAQKSDIHTIIEFIKELAQYEGLDSTLTVTEDTLTDWIFIRNKAEVLLGIEDEKVIGFCLFYHNFSTFIGHAGIFIEDLYIAPEYQNKGYGKALLQKVAKISVDRGCKKLELSCPNWNTAGADFYKHMGIKPMNDWTTYRVCEDDLYKICKN